MALFSGVNIAMPTVGAFGNKVTTTAVFIARFFIQLLLFGVFSFHTLAYHIPGYCAALYWNTQHWSIRLFLPVACMVLFILHPVGFNAFAYALYWLIPIGLYFIPHNNTFLTALGSTFTAHAIGSVIWLYTVPMTSAMWLSLIPVVFIERILFATGMVVVYYAIQIGIKQVNYLRAKRTSRLAL